MEKKSLGTGLRLAKVEGLRGLKPKSLVSSTVEVLCVLTETHLDLNGVQPCTLSGWEGKLNT